MPGRVDFSLAEAVAAIRTGILTALASAVNEMSAGSQVLLPERIRISAHVIEAGSGERFFLSATAGAGAPRWIEFRWRCDAPFELQIVGPDRNTGQSNQE
jgi:hypothetical protein